MPRNKKSAAVVEFLGLLKCTGDFYGKPFKVLPWQREIVEAVYGTVKENGNRQYKYAYLEIPKKNGKTELIAGLGLFHLLNDPPSGQIYCCAADREQAALVYLAAKQKIEQDEFLDSMLDVVDSMKIIRNTQTGTFIKVMSSEAYSKHGVNPSVIIFDELHALPKRDLWDFMTFGSGSARKEQLIWVITTAGNDPDKKTVGWEQHEYSQKVLNGEIEDPTRYVKIYGASEDANIFDEKVWKACNPSLGVTIDIDNVRDEAIHAKNSESSERLFRWLRLNQWVSLKNIGWLPITLWDETQGNWNRRDLLGQECYVGIDLSTTTDLTATAPVFPPNGERNWRFFIDAFIPEENMKEREYRDHVPFARWVKSGAVHATPGNVVDYGALAAHIKQLDKDYKVKFFCGDAWHLEILKQLLPDSIQERFVVIPQNMAGMSPAMHELERLFRGSEIEHEENPCGRWAFGNVMIATDGNENKKPMKNRSIERIDPICAVINGAAGAIKNEDTTSVYEERGMRIL